MKLLDDTRNSWGILEGVPEGISVGTVLGIKERTHARVTEGTYDEI